MPHPLQALKCSERRLFSRKLRTPDIVAREDLAELSMSLLHAN